MSAVDVAREPGRRRPLSVDDYHRMGEAGIFAPDERVELIEGEIVHLAPIGSTHAGIVADLTRLLVLAVGDRAAGDRAVVWVQNPVVLSDLSEPQPDLALLRPRADFYKSALPLASDVLLAIEVADTTPRQDRDVKIPLYARRGIPETWLVDIENRRLVTYHDAGERGYRHESVPDDLGGVAPRRLDGVSLDLSSLF